MPQGLRDPLAHQHDRPDDRQGKEDVDDASNRVPPEVPQVVRSRSREATDHGDEHGHPDRRRQEVLEGQGEHLREIAHRCLAAVGLPVRVGQKAGRRIEGDIGIDGGQLLRIQGQVVLDPHQQIDEQHADHAEPQHHRRVTAPRLLRVGGGVSAHLALVVRRAYDLAFLDHDRTDWNVVMLERPRRLAQREAHEVLVAREEMRAHREAVVAPGQARGAPCARKSPLSGKL